MSDFVNPDTRDIVLSANDMPSPWVVCTRAQSEAWMPIPTQYRKWVIDHIEEMTQPEKDAVDTAMRNAARDAAAAQLDNVEDILRAFMQVMLDELNAHALKHNAILDAVDAATSLADLKSRVSLIQDYPQRTGTQIKTAMRNKLGT